MEFPSTGDRCSFQTCKQLDFLPFTCKYCQLIFCKEHFNATAHSCSQFIDNVATGSEKTSTFQCTFESCETNVPVEMLCVKCKRNFCLQHRYHGCLELSEEERLKDLEKWKKPKVDFLRAKSIVDKQITDKLRKSKKSSTANKVQLMRLKGRSNGPISVPTADRRYFMVHPPNNHQKLPAKGAFVSVNWSIGKVTDSLADTVGIANSNNVAGSKKLRMFDFSAGNIVTSQMDTLLSEIMEKNILIDGQDVILEYSDGDAVDPNLYN